MGSPAISPVDAGVKVGDFFVSHWGYDQTNVDFYKVVGLTAKGIKIQRWSTTRVEDDSTAYTDAVVPGKFPATSYSWTDGEQTRGPAPVKQKKLSGSADRPWINLTSYSGASKWSGKSCHATNPLYGH